MLKLYDQNKNPLGYITKYTGLCIVSDLSTGDKELSFTYQANAKASEIEAEYYIETEDDIYVVKEIELSTEDNPKITCKLDLEGLESDSIEDYSAERTTLEYAANLAVSGTGWTAVVNGITKKRTYVVDQWSTPYDILIGLTDAWMCELYFDSKNKIVYFMEELGEDRGVYLTASLNLKKAQLSSDTYDYYTRIIPYGYDDLTISSVNSGKNYVENFQYSSKIRTMVWQNTNYTEADELLEDATKKLEEISKPTKSYSVDLADLAKQNQKYSILSFGLGDTVLLLDERTGIKEKQRIVKLTEYPHTPEKNKCELSSTVPSFIELTSNMKVVTDTVSNVTNSSGSIDGNSVKYIVQGTTVDGVTGIEVIIEGSDALAKAIELSEEYTNTTLTSYSTTSEMEAAITTYYDEIMLYVTNNYSTTETMYTNISAAVDEAESWTATQLESYSTTSEMNTAIDLMKDSIELSVSETYATSTELVNQIEHAIESAETYTETKLESYSTTTEMNSAIDMAKDSINLSVSETYATTSSVQTITSDVLADAESYTDTKLESYSTTEEVASMIELGAGTIDLTVYAKTTEVTSAIETCEKYADGVGETVTTEVQEYAENYVAASLVLKIEDGVGVLSGNADRIELTTGQLVITSDGLTLDANGNASFYGSINATSFNMTSNDYANFYCDLGLFGNMWGETTCTAHIYRLYTTSLMDCGGHFYCDGAADFYSTLDVDGKGSFGSSVSIDTTLGVGGDANFYSSVGISSNLTVIGTIWYGTLTESSDSRLKTELESLDKFDAFFDSLKAGRFQYTYDSSGQYHSGMYAQEVLDALTECGLTESDIAVISMRDVDENDPAYHGLAQEYGLNYMEFVPLLIDQVQKLKTEYSLLKGYIDMLLSMQEAAA